MATVQLSEETKRYLVELAAHLQLARKRRVSLDEAVSHLLAQQKLPVRRWELFDEFYGCLQPTRVHEAYRLLRAGRRADERHLATLERQYRSGR